MPTLNTIISTARDIPEETKVGYLYKRSILCLTVFLFIACEVVADESPEWLATHKVHVNKCYVRGEYNEDGSFARFGGDTIIASCTWLWENSREIDWLAVAIRADEKRKLGRFSESLRDIELAIGYVESEQFNSRYLIEEAEEFGTYFDLMRQQICSEQFEVTQGSCN